MKNSMAIDQIAFSIEFDGSSRSFRAIRNWAPKLCAALLVFALAVTLEFANLTPSLAQADQTDQRSAGEAILRYSEPALKEVDGCGPKDIVTTLKCVAKKEDGETEIDETGAMATAILTLTLEPKLTVLEDGTFIASIRSGRADVFGFGGGSFIIMGRMKAESRSAVRKESRLVQDRLKNWKLSLNGEQIAELKKEGVVDVFVRRPFEHLKMLELDDPSVMLPYVYKFPKPNFVFLRRDGDDWIKVESKNLEYGDVFKITADMAGSPGSATIDLELDWDKFEGPVTVTLTASGAIFQSDVFQLIYSDKAWLVPVN